MVKKKENKGITLMALVITIIVLLILVGVTIVAISGENGIIQRAVEAREETEKAEKIEQNTLNSYEDTINEYMGIDWDRVLENAEKHPDQKTSTAIGVGTDGRAVNMDLWEYTKLDDGTYALNDADSLITTSTAGYTGNIVDGKIEGTIPQYIKDETDNDFVEVTSIEWLFYENTKLEISPILPNTLTNMKDAFNGCTNLITVGEIPDRVTNMQGTFNGCISIEKITDLSDKLENLSYGFQGCSSLKEVCEIPPTVKNLRGTFQNCVELEEAPKLNEGIEDMSVAFSGCSKLNKIDKIPNTVLNMGSTFYNCTSLMVAPELSENVENLQQTFTNCTSLVTPPTKIPSSVNNMQLTFGNCSNLNGEIIVEANITGENILIWGTTNQVDYWRCFNDVSKLEVKCPERIYNLLTENNNYIRLGNWSSNVTISQI